MAKTPESPILYDQILRSLYFESERSCGQLSQELDKSIPVISQKLHRLLDLGLIRETGFSASSGGRRPMGYALVEQAFYVLSVSMDQLFTRLALFDLARRPVLEPLLLELNLYEHPRPAEYLVDQIKSYIRQSGLDARQLLGAGLAMPGFINLEEGVNYTFLEAQRAEGHRAFFARELDMPVYLDNDSSLTALAEWRFGQARGLSNAMVVNIGWGTGLGMIVNGSFFRGHQGFAGEFSHIPLCDNNVLCECGKRGCLETETSLLTLASRALEELRQGKKSRLKAEGLPYMGEAILDAAARGDQLGIELLSDMGYTLGKGIAVLLHILNPELVVLSGRGARAGKILLAPIQHSLNQFCIPRLMTGTRLEVSGFAEDAPLIGAAALVLEQTPVLEHMLLASGRRLNEAQLS